MDGRAAWRGLAIAGFAALLPSIARAEVTVNDATGCLAFEPVDLELRAVIGDEVVDRFQLLVTLDDGEGPSNVLRLAVSDHDRSVWTKSLDVEDSDCDVLVELIGLSVERGLATLPGWGLKLKQRPPELAVSVGVSLPWTVRLSVGADVWLPVRDAFHWDIAPELLWAPVRELGDVGSVQLMGVTAGTGPAVAIPTGRSALRFVTRLAGGLAVLVGSDADLTETLLAPRMAWSTDALWAAPWGLRTGVRVEVPIVRLGYRDTVSGVTLEREPRARVGLVAMFGAKIRTSDSR